LERTALKNKAYPTLFPRTAASKKENMDFSKKSNQFPLQARNRVKNRCAEVFFDKISGKIMWKPALNQCFSHVECGNIF
jgi:hypothetical protein